MSGNAPPPTHYAALIVFREGTTQDEATKLLELIQKKLTDPNFTRTHAVGFNWAVEYPQLTIGRR